MKGAYGINRLRPPALSETSRKCEVKTGAVPSKKLVLCKMERISVATQLGAALRPLHRLRLSIKSRWRSRKDDPGILAIKYAANNKYFSRSHLDPNWNREVV